MSARTVTPAEAQEFATKPALSVCKHCGAPWPEDFRRRCGECSGAEVLFVRHPVVGDLAATVASEPARIVATVEAERAAILARIVEAAVTWGALTPAEQTLVSAFASYLAGVVRGRGTP